MANTPLTFFREYSLYHLHRWTIWIPILTLLSCLVVSILFHFENVTKTHCRNWQFFPSVSSAIGNNAPEKYIWRLGIGLYSFPKMMVEFHHHQFFWWQWNARNKLSAKFFFFPASTLLFSIVNLTTLASGLLENFSLYVLTVVSSNEDKPVHEMAFVALVVFANIHFVSFLLTSYWSESRHAKANWAVKQLSKIALLHTGVFFIGMVFYTLHNAFCVPGFFSIFAMCEWTMVALNVAFHVVALSQHNDYTNFKLEQRLQPEMKT